MRPLVGLVLLLAGCRLPDQFTIGAQRTFVDYPGESDFNSNGMNYGAALSWSLGTRHDSEQALADHLAAIERNTKPADVVGAAKRLVPDLDRGESVGLSSVALALLTAVLAKVKASRDQKRRTKKRQA